MQDKLEKLYYDLHYERLSWDELSRSTRTKLFSDASSQDVVEKDWANMILSEAIRSNPELFLTDMPVKLRPQFMRTYLQWAGAESLSQINPEEWPNAEHPQQIRRQAVEIAKVMGEPEQFVLALRDNEIKAPEQYETIIRAVTFCSQTYLKPLSEKIPVELYGEDKRLLDIMLSRDPSLEESLTAKFATHASLDKSARPNPDKAHGESQLDSSKDLGLRTLLVHCDEEGKINLWPIKLGNFAETSQPLPPSELSEAEVKAYKSLSSNHTLGLIHGDHAMKFNIGEAGAQLKNFFATTVEKMVAKLGSDEAKVADSQYSPRTSSVKPAPEEIIARGELLAAYAAGHFLKLSFQSQKDDGLRHIIEKVAELPVQAKTINKYLDELHEFYESTGISNPPSTWLTLTQLRSVGLAEPNQTSKSKQNIGLADSKTPTDLVSEGVSQQAEYWPAPTY